MQPDLRAPAGPASSARAPTACAHVKEAANWQLESAEAGPPEGKPRREYWPNDFTHGDERFAGGPCLVSFHLFCEVIVVSSWLVLE